MLHPKPNNYAHLLDYDHYLGTFVPQMADGFLWGPPYESQDAVNSFSSHKAAMKRRKIRPQMPRAGNDQSSPIQVFLQPQGLLV